MVDNKKSILWKDLKTSSKNGWSWHPHIQNIVVTEYNNSVSLTEYLWSKIIVQDHHNNTNTKVRCEYMLFWVGQSSVSFLDRRVFNAIANWYVNQEPTKCMNSMRRLRIVERIL